MTSGMVLAPNLPETSGHDDQQPSCPTENWLSEENLALWQRLTTTIEQSPWPLYATAGMQRPLHMWLWCCEEFLTAGL